MVVQKEMNSGLSVQPVKILGVNLEWHEKLLEKSLTTFGIRLVFLSLQIFDCTLEIR